MLREETAASPDRRRAALAGLEAYQHARRPERPPPPPVVATSGRARLLRYGKGGRPVVFVPSLINPPFILDLAPENSMLRWLASQKGIDPMLVDWGTPDPCDRDMDIAAHVEQLLLPLLDTLDAPPVLAGYCLGGTMAVAAACRRTIAGLALIAAPWHFAGYGSSARADAMRSWNEASPACEALGMVPMELLQAGFWRLDPARTITKYERFARLATDSEEARAFVALEDWANDGAPLPFAAGRDLFRRFLLEDATGRGAWNVGGAPVDPARIDAPILDIVSETDRIVPHATALARGEQRRLRSGHVGMVIGRRARARLWQPLADWIARLDVPK